MKTARRYAHDFVTTEIQICGGPNCVNALEQPVGQGRRRRYCSDQCRARANRRRRQETVASPGYQAARELASRSTLSLVDSGLLVELHQLLLGIRDTVEAGPPQIRKAMTGQEAVDLGFQTLSERWTAVNAVYEQLVRTKVPASRATNA